MGYTLLGVVTSVCKPEGLSWTDEAPTCGNVICRHFSGNWHQTLFNLRTNGTISHERIIIIVIRVMSSHVLSYTLMDDTI